MKLVFVILRQLKLCWLNWGMIAAIACLTYYGGEASAQELPSEAEDVASSAETETMLFDLYLGDTRKGTALVQYTDTTFSFRNANDALEQLGPTKDSQKVLELLSGTIDKTKVIADVGSVSYNLDTFQVIVQLNPELLFGRELQTNGELLPTPTSGLSYLQTLRLNVSGELEESTTSAVTLKNTISYKTFWMGGDATAINGLDDDVEIDNLTANLIVDDQRLSGGMLSSSGLFQARSADTCGLSMQTAEEVYINDEQRRGSKFEIFVPSRSKVDFYRGSRLLSSQMLNYGLQEVDTSAFPQGSYEVEIVITDDNNIETREHRFYTKSGLLAIRDRPLLSVTTGFLRDGLDVSDIPIGQASLTWRALDMLQFDTSGYGGEELQIGSLNLLGIWHDLIFTGGYLRSTNNDSAYMAGLYGNLDWINFDFRITEILNGYGYKSAFNSTQTSYMGEDTENDSDQFSANAGSWASSNPSLASLLLGEGQDSISASISKSIDDITIRLGYNQNQKGDDEERRTMGGKITYYFIRDSEDTLNVDASYYRTQDGNELGLFTNYSHRFDKWRYNGKLSSQDQEEQDEAAMMNELQYDDRGSSARGTSLRVGNKVTHKRKDNNKSETIDNEVKLEHANAHVRIGGDIRDIRNDSNGGTSIAFSGESSLVANSDGALSMTAPKTSEALFIAEVPSSTTNSDIEILVDGQVKETIKAGDTIVIGLSPYKTYAFSIRPTVKADLVYYDSTIYKATLFPGNVVRYTWAVDKVFIAIGRIIDSHKNPVKYARIRGTKEYTATEGDGSFQAELSGNEELYIEEKNISCRITIPKEKPTEAISDYGTLVCK